MPRHDSGMSAGESGKRGAGWAGRSAPSHGAPALGRNGSGAGLSRPEPFRSLAMAAQGLIPPSDNIRAEPSYRFKYLPGRAHQKWRQFFGGAGAAASAPGRRRPWRWRRPPPSPRQSVYQAAFSAPTSSGRGSKRPGDLHGPRLEPGPFFLMHYALSCFVEHRPHHLITTARYFAAPIDLARLIPGGGQPKHRPD
jgi:hypothetical protein